MSETNPEHVPIPTRQAVVAVGFLGWSNIRSGTEFYSEERGENGRWVERRVDGAGSHTWGDLLADELEEKGAPEGSRLVVVALPRFSKVKRQDIIDAIVPVLGPSEV